MTTQTRIRRLGMVVAALMAILGTGCTEAFAQLNEREPSSASHSPSAAHSPKTDIESVTRSLEVLQANKVTCTFSPAHNFWMIQMSYGRANKVTLNALSHLLESSFGVVDLPHNNLGKEELSILAHTHGIWELNLADTNIGDDELKIIVELPALHTLSLERTAITDAGLEHLQSLKELSRLKLDDTRITGRGISHLKALPKLENLRIPGTQVADNSCDALADIRSLRTLDISRTDITDRGLELLLKLDYLQELLVTKSKITKEGARAFRTEHTAKRAEAIKKGTIDRSFAKPVIIGIQ